MRPLFKPEKLPDIADFLARKVVRTAQNSAGVVLLVWLISSKHFYDFSLKALLIRAQSTLSRSDLLAALTIPPDSTLGTRFGKELNGARFARLEPPFFEYLLVRLPYLLKTNRPNGRYPTEAEIDHITHRCLELGTAQIPNLAYHTWSRGEAARMRSLTRWWVPTATREAAIYDIEWLWEALRASYPKIFEDTNRGLFARTMVEESSTMIYTHIAQVYRDLTFWALLPNPPEAPFLKEPSDVAATPTETSQSADAHDEDIPH